MRTFPYQSQLTSGSLALALAPALTPVGIVENPHFFAGYAIQPQILARGLLVLADVTSTRYFKYTPVSLRDPILSAQGDRLRAECFSACNGVYARLDLLQQGFEGEIGFGTTNVDIGMELRTALTQVKQQDKLHLAIGGDGLTTTHTAKPTDNIAYMPKKVLERPVQMPDRWVRALGNAAEIHKGMKAVFKLEGIGAQAFIASLPPATSKNQAGWLVPSPGNKGAKLSPRRMPNAAYISGIHRLNALKRVMTSIKAITVYAPTDNEPGAFMIEADLPGIRITLSLTSEAWQGYSGEGALLTSLAEPDVLEDADSISSLLTFEAVIDEAQLMHRWNITSDRVKAAMAVLAVSGKVGFDAYDNAYFHRELPDDPNRVLKDNPRLVAAQKLTDAVRPNGDNLWLVTSKEAEYQVIYNPPEENAARCTCTWYLNHLNKRGPCKHILAVQLKIKGALA